MYLLTAAGFFFLSIAMAILWVFGLGKAHDTAGNPSEVKSKALLWTTIAIALWMATTGLLSFIGFFEQFDSLPPRMFFLFPIPLISAFIIPFLRPTKKLLEAIPDHWLILPQAFRILVEILLWMLYLQEVFSIHLTLEGRNFDILAGILGLIIGLVWMKKGKVPKWVSIGYNILGLGLLGNIVGMAILTFPTPFQQFTEGPGNTIIATFPYIWLPAVLVTTAYWFHFLSLRKAFLNQK